MPVYLKKERFEEIIARRNISQGDFARAIGVTKSHISMLKGTRKRKVGVSPKVREKMLKILGVEFDEIFFISNQKGGDR